jgi:dedicator of cytokinesis protein 3
VKQLGTALNGAVDSPINGGVKLYRDTFLDESYLRDHPIDGAQLGEFKAAYEAYVGTVHAGLELHGKVCKDIAFHEALKNRRWCHQLAKLQS